MPVIKNMNTINSFFNYIYFQDYVFCDSPKKSAEVLKPQLKHHRLTDTASTPYLSLQNTQRWLLLSIILWWSVSFMVTAVILIVW